MKKQFFSKILYVAALFLMIMPLAVMAQVASPEILEKAAAQTGKTEAELEALMAGQTDDEILLEPGMSSLPVQAQPTIILPMDLENMLLYRKFFQLYHLQQYLQI